MKAMLKNVASAAHRGRAQLARMRHGACPPLPCRPSVHRLTSTGFTLVELLTVIGIIVILLGIGVGAFVSMRDSMVLPGVVERIAGALQAARSTAISQREQAFVRFYLDDEGKHVMAACGLRTIAMFHFDGQDEDEIFVAGLGQHGTPVGFTQPFPTVLGKYGQGIRLENGEYINAGHSGLHAIRDGVSISAYVRPRVSPSWGDNPEPRLPIVGKFDEGSIGGVFALYLMHAPAMDRFRVAGSVRIEGQTEPVLLRTVTEPLLKADEWAYVSMVYRPGASQVEVSIDGVVRDHDTAYALNQGESSTGSGRIILSNAPLLVGRTGPDSFYGDLDEVKVAAFVQEEPYRVTDMARVSVSENGGPFAGRIVFDSLGWPVVADTYKMHVRLIRHGTTGVPGQWIVIDPSGNIRVEQTLAAAPTPTP